MPTKILSPRLQSLFWSRLLLAFAFGLSFPFIPIYFAARGLPLGVIGMLMAANLLASAFGHLAGGPLSDGLGSRLTMIASLRWRSIATMFLALLIFFNAEVSLVAGLILAASFIGHLFQPACDAYISSEVSFTQRSSVFSSMRVGINAGWALGPAVGGLLASHLGYGTLFALTAVLTGINALWLDRKLPVQPPVSPMDRGHYRMGALVRFWAKSFDDPSWRFFVQIYFLGSLVYSQLFTMLGLYLSRYRGEPEAVIGLLFGWNGLLVVLTQIKVTKRLENIPLTLACCWGLVFYAMGYGLLSVIESIPMYFLAVTITTLGEVIHSPAANALTANLASQLGGSARQGSYIALAQSAGVLGSLAASVLTGYLLELAAPVHPSYPWLTIGTVALAASVSYLFLQKRITDKEILGLRRYNKIND
ncbi:MAG: MFS transporter [Elusimicrobia bacterium]|nr:MFS transporter [Elusimicrobiota bacterium]